MSEAMQAMKEIRAVRMTMETLIPSTPMKYSMLNSRIHTKWCTNCGLSVMVGSN